MPVVTVEFETVSVTVNESDGTVTVNLVRRTGTLTNNIIVCINVTMIMDPAIFQRMCTMFLLLFILLEFVK